MTEPLIEVIAAVLGVPAGQLNDDSSARTVQTWDSLRQLSILLALESAYGITIGSDDAVQLTSIKAIRSVLSKHGVHPG